MDSSGRTSRLIGGVFSQPSEELAPLLCDPESLVPHSYSHERQAAINELIHSSKEVILVYAHDILAIWSGTSAKYNASFVYHAMFAYFLHNNVALKRLAKFFKESSDKEREHAAKLMEYQNNHGGQVKLKQILISLAEYNHCEKGNAIYAMEIALSLEKLTIEKLLNLHRVAEKANDVWMTIFLESEFLSKQTEHIKKLAEYVAELESVVKEDGMAVRSDAFE